jgi:hypothetical protein
VSCLCVKVTSLQNKLLTVEAELRAEKDVKKELERHAFYFQVLPAQSMVKYIYIYIYTFIHQNGGINKKRERKTKVTTKLLIGAAMHKALCHNGNTIKENNG